MRTPDHVPSEVMRNLLEASRLHEQRRGRRTPIDMSAAAVGARLRRAADLRDLCLALGALGKSST